MITLANYQITQQIYEGSHSRVYRAMREHDGKSVIIKVLKEEHSTYRELTRYQQEYKIISSLNLEGVIRTYGLEKYQRVLAIILEDFGGESLRALLDNHNNPISCQEFLTIATKITASLGLIHAKKIIHKNINPANIIYNSHNGLLKIIDFGIATNLNIEKPQLKVAEDIEANLAYVSPEQTGRMNRVVDYRTDFYSLGVTFYELLTNQLPFNSGDSIELLHAHMAKRPIPPHYINPQIPPTISSIVMKLLAKNAEDRYQSCWGLEADLELCLYRWETENNITSFPLGQHDLRQNLQISQKLYGRKVEIALLMAAFNRIASGKSELLLISGYSGVGKSALVQEIYKPITALKGYFISGKFDKLQRNIPYSAFLKSFQQLLATLLTENEDEIQQLREEIIAALGEHGQVLIEVIPELQFIIGKQHNAPKLAPTEAQNRFNLLFCKFIRVFTKSEHPLVIFLDDLQWADSASLQLLQLLMTNIDSQYLLLIGAYRSNEVNSVHGLTLTLRKIAQAKTNIEKIALAPLKLNHINHLLTDTFKSSLKKTKLLAELVLSKTRGNPFFVNEFIKKLYKDKLIDFDFNYVDKQENPGGWHWNLERIYQQEFTDNIVEFMTDKLQKMPSTTKKILQLAACIGNRFNLEQLGIISLQSHQETSIALKTAIAEGLILPLGDDYKSIELNIVQYAPQELDALTIEYKFAHDRIQYAAYSLILGEDKSVFHYQVGKRLWESLPSQNQEEQIFTIVNQLNLGIDCINDQAEKLKLAQLNFDAGQKAQKSSAYTTAFDYFCQGLQLLSQSSWLKDYELTLELHEAAAETAYLNGQLSQMEELINLVKKHARSLLDKVKIYEVQIQAYIAQNQPQAAVETGLTILKLLGVIIPQKPGKVRTLLDLLKSKHILEGREIDNLVNSSLMEDPYKLAAMRIMSRISSAAFFVAPNVFPFIVFQEVALSLKYGNAPESSFAYVSYGLIMCKVVEDIDIAYQLGRLSLEILKNFDNHQIAYLKCRTILVANTFIRHRKEHLQVTLNPLQQAYFFGLETGDMEYVSHCAFVYCYYSYLTGKELNNLAAEMASYSKILKQIKQQRNLALNELYRQVVLNLLGKSRHSCQLNGEAYEEAKMFPLHLEAGDGSVLHRVHLEKLILCYLFQNYQQALEHSQQAERYLQSVEAMIAYTLFHCYDSLTRLALYPTANSIEQKAILKKVIYNQKKLSKWVEYAPQNHLQKFYLVEAERYRVLGLNREAREAYEYAINLAKKHEFIQDEALGNELAAQFYLGNGETKFAQAYLQEAYYCYHKWGAKSKYEELERCYPFLQIQTKELLNQNPLTNSERAVVKEPSLKTLLSKLMEVALKNSGAQLGILILNSRYLSASQEIQSNLERFLIIAEAQTEPDTIKVLNPQPLQKAKIPFSVINYVKRTSKSLVLANAAEEFSFSQDPYIKEYKPRSLLAAPLIQKHNLIGILYLENNLISGAFTPERLELLEFLLVQAATAIVN